MDLRNGMERRMSERIPTTLGMQIYAYGMLVASGMTVDMSKHGLLMRVEEDFSDDELDPGKHLDVMLEYSGQIPAQQWFPITVVRKCEKGIAARFVGLETQAG